MKNKNGTCWKEQFWELLKRTPSSGKEEEMREGMRGFENDENLLFRYVKQSSNIRNNSISDVHWENNTEKQLY